MTTAQNSKYGHRHTFPTGRAPNGATRTCETCGTRQVKTQGRWKEATDAVRECPDYYHAITVGQVWRHKRDRSRRVEVTGVSAPWSDQPARDDIFVYVTRNTSARRQPMRRSHLLRNYELAITDVRPVR